MIIFAYKVIIIIRKDVKIIIKYQILIQEKV